MKKLSWVVVIIFSILAMLILVLGTIAAKGAPQEAAAAALAVAIAVIPYCFARAISELKA